MELFPIINLYCISAVRSLHELQAISLRISEQSMVKIQVHDIPEACLNPEPHVLTLFRSYLNILIKPRLLRFHSGLMYFIVPPGDQTALYNVSVLDLGEYQTQYPHVHGRHRIPQPGTEQFFHGNYLPCMREPSEFRTASSSSVCKDRSKDQPRSRQKNDHASLNLTSRSPIAIFYLPSPSPLIICPTSRTTATAVNCPALPCHAMPCHAMPFNFQAHSTTVVCTVCLASSSQIETHLRTIFSTSRLLALLQRIAAPSTGLIPALESQVCICMHARRNIQ